jgi:hypothetical protein
MGERAAAGGGAGVVLVGSLQQTSEPDLEVHYLAADAAAGGQAVAQPARLPQYGGGGGDTALRIQ